MAGAWCALRRPIWLARVRSAVRCRSLLAPRAGAFPMPACRRAACRRLDRTSSSPRRVRAWRAPERVMPPALVPEALRRRLAGPLDRAARWGRALVQTADGVLSIPRPQTAGRGRPASTASRDPFRRRRDRRNRLRRAMRRPRRPARLNIRRRRRPSGAIPRRRAEIAEAAMRRSSGCRSIRRSYAIAEVRRAEIAEAALAAEALEAAARAQVAAEVAAAEAAATEAGGSPKGFFPRAARWSKVPPGLFLLGGRGYNLF